MKNLLKFISLSFIGVVAFGCSSMPNVPEVYDPAYGDGYYVLTPQIGEEPRINGAEVFGVRPGSPFQFAVAASGVRPMNFKAENLPEGLSIDSYGVIRGTIKDLAKKSYQVKLTCSNAKGNTSETLEIVVGDDFCLTPPMGWSSWIATRRDVSEETVMENALAMKKLMLDQYGYYYVNIDDCWQGASRGGEFNAILPNPEKFTDMKGLSDKIHDMGFKFGIYSTPWITSYAKFVGGSSNNEDGYWDESYILDLKNANVEGRASRMGKYRFDENDAKQWAAWGVDYMKYDWNPNDSASIVNMALALQGVDRDIAFSISNSCPLSQGENVEKYCQVARTGGDIRARWSDDGSHLNLWENWNNHNKWLEKAYEGGPGHTPDADFLMVGLQLYGSKDSLTVDQLYHHMSSYILWGTPLLLSTKLEELQPFELSLLTNVEMLDINQDKLSKPGRCTDLGNGIQIIVKPLSNGDKAVGIFNFNDKATIGGFNWEMVGVSGKQVVRDVWRNENIGIAQDNFKANIRPHGVVVVRLSSI